MDRTSPLPSDEVQPLNTRPSQNDAEAIGLRNHPYDRSISPLSPQGSTIYYSEDFGGRGETPPSYTPIDSQEQKQASVSHHMRDLPNNQSNNSIQQLWLWELLSIAVAALALVAIVIVLVLRRDRPLPKWPSAISINALIAVFTAIFKACLLMPIAEGIGQLRWLWYQKSRPLRYMEQWDLASRGPWGSLLLIFMLRSRGLAVIGALLTIVAMAVDPFTQQVVQFYSCSRVVEGEFATVPFSNNYTAGWINGNKSSQVDPQMQSAMYIGLLDPLANTSAALKFECRTGNCTFPSTDDGAAFLSLALESRCTDIGSDIAFSVGQSNFNDSVYGQYMDPTTAIAALPGYELQLNNYSSNIMLSGSQTPTDWPSHSLRHVAYLMASSGLGDYQADPQSTYAFECEFYPAVNTYSANITNGVLLEQVLETQRMDVWPTNYGTTTAQIIVNRTIRGGKWHECTGHLDPSDENNLPMIIADTAYDFPRIGSDKTTETLKNYFNTTWWPQDCVYWLPYNTATSLSEAIASLMGNESLSYDSIIRRAKGNPWSVSLWNNGTPTLDSVQATMDGMTRSVTARLRQGDGVSVNMGPANGTVWEIQTCVGVRWEWLALPAGLLLLTVVFLVLTIAKTRLTHAQVWKSSIFAVLFSGLGHETRQAGGPVEGLGEMKVAADRTVVRLEDTKEGFRLVNQA